MVRKINIVEVYTKPEADEEATPEPTTSDENTEPTVEPMMHETSDTEPEPPPPPPQPETKSEEGEPSSPARKPKK